jgi:hypothetical protein
MASTFYPPAAAASTTGIATTPQIVTATAANVLYRSSLALGVGTYKIQTGTGGVDTKVTFWSGTTEQSSVTTTSGTITFSLSDPCTQVTYYTTTGTNVTITFSTVGANVSFATSGTSSGKVNTSQTTNYTGLGYVVLSGGGGGGQGTAGNVPAQPGGAGGISAAKYTFNGSDVLAIGAGGNLNGGTGGTTNYGNMTPATGGAGGTSNGNTPAGSGGPAASVNIYPWFISTSGASGGPRGNANSQNAGNDGGAGTAGFAYFYTSLGLG